MSDFLQPKDEFLQKVIEIIEKNLADEDFEVPDLAAQLNMSRSNLLRKVKKSSGFSVSVFIRKVRLYHSKKILRDGTFTISEVAYKVGFNSISYFTKCFREEFGHTPGDINQILENETDEAKPEVASAYLGKMTFVGLGVLLLMILSLILFQSFSSDRSEGSLEKTIAVLPFKNDSDDSSNTYIVNGLMESVLDNLQRIEDLEVTSRTSTERYRNSNKTIRELSEELEVNYFVEGSGQKIGDQILLTIQLINGRDDKHIWSRQYKREANEIFNLQMEVAKNIAENIEAIITPEEQKLIEKIPTNNLEAYDYYLKGIDLLNRSETNEELWEAISNFKMAIEEDIEFANPYAYIAICYYYLEFYQTEKEYGHEINAYADKGLLYDSELPENHLAKALFYQQDGQYQLAVDYFEKVLRYDPNATRVHNYLSDIYAYHVPDTEKYLIHSIKGLKTIVIDQDSTLVSSTYLRMASALAQNGFVLEAEKYAIKSIDFDANNLYSKYLNIYIQLAKDFNLERTKSELLEVLEKDTMRLDIIQEIAKVNYTLENYEEAWYYYNKFMVLKEMLGLDIYSSIDVNIAFVLDQIGNEEEAESMFDTFLLFAENDETIYKDLHFAAYHAARGNVDEGMKYLKAFTSQEDFQYWIVLFLDKDPVILRLSSHPDFNETLRLIEEQFWKKHARIRNMLEEENVI